MDNDRQLRAEVVRALDAVTPPAPWLASALGASLRERRRRGGSKIVAAARFGARGLSAAVAMALVLLIAVAAVGVFVLREAGQPVPARRPSTGVTVYAAMVNTDYSKLAAVRTRYNTCNFLTDSACPIAIAQSLAVRQQWIDDLDRTPPPAEFASLHARLRAILIAGGSDLSQMLAAFNAGDANWFGLAGSAAGAEAEALDRLEPYILLKAYGGGSHLDLASARYAALVAQGYDNLDLSTLASTLVACKLTDPACPGYASALQRELQAFLAHLQSTAPPSRFASRSDLLLADLVAEAGVLDDLNAAYAAHDDNSLWVAKQKLTIYETQINRDGGYILYPV